MYYIVVYRKSPIWAPLALTLLICWMLESQNWVWLRSPLTCPMKVLLCSIPLWLSAYLQMSALASHFSFSATSTVWRSCPVLPVCCSSSLVEFESLRPSSQNALQGTAPSHLRGEERKSLLDKTPQWLAKGRQRCSPRQWYHCPPKSCRELSQPPEMWRTESSPGR